MFRTKIRTNVRLAEAPSHGKSIFDYAPESNGAEDYMALAREVAGVSGEELLEPIEDLPGDIPLIEMPDESGPGPSVGQAPAA